MTIALTSGLQVAGWMLATLALSALITALTISYARRRQMMDMPGQRRSHLRPTPRGGGLGIVVAVLFCIMLPFVALAPRDPASFRMACAIFSLLAVAAVGWIDDHGSLSARYRFGAHCVAAALLLFAMAPAVSVVASSLGALIGLGIGSAILAIFMLATACVWSINLHNFMDGIDGLLASQAIFVFVALGCIGLAFGSSPSWMASVVAAFAVLGFLPFNFPKARVFMGDVGSGSLGLMIAMAIIYQLGDHSLDLTTGLIACSAFVTDSTATLLSRMLRGRRWYHAHREHLYQGLVRSGCSHARVVGYYLAWNMLIVLPAMLLIQSPRSVMAVETLQRQVDPQQMSVQGLVVLLAVYALALVIWVFGKRHCQHRARQGGRHGLA